MFTGASCSLLLHPSEFIESRNEAEAISGAQTGEEGQVEHEVLASLRGDKKPVLRRRNMA